MWPSFQEEGAKREVIPKAHTYPKHRCLLTAIRTHTHTPFHISNLICATTNMSRPHQNRKVSSYQSLQGANVLLLFLDLFLDFDFDKFDQPPWQPDESLRAPISCSTIGFVPEGLELCVLICQLGAEFRHLRLQLVNVLVEYGSTPPGRKRRRRLSPFIGRIIRRHTIIIIWNKKSVPGIVHHEPQ